MSCATPSRAMNLSVQIVREPRLTQVCIATTVGNASSSLLGVRSSRIPRGPIVLDAAEPASMYARGSCALWMNLLVDWAAADLYGNRI